MKAEELRIGNIINEKYLDYMRTDEGEIKYEGIDETSVDLGLMGKISITGGSCLEDYEPTPLTEEWLKRFGFVHDGCRDPNCYEETFALLDNDQLEVIMIDKDDFYLKPDSNCVFHVKIEYVHQLQNLFYAITGKEL